MQRMIGLLKPVRAQRVDLPAERATGAAAWRGKVWYLIVGGTVITVMLGEILVPSVPSYFWQVVLVQALYATSVNLLIGYANLPSFGQAAFFGTGAYTAALVSGGLPLGIALVAAVLASAALAVLVGLVAVRTSGIVFANVTLAFGQMMYLLASNTGLVGGENGLAGISFAPLSPRAFGVLLIVSVAACMLLLWWLLRTPFGATVKAMRDNPTRASALGIGVYGYRLKIFTIAGAVAGLAGALYVFAIGIATPDLLHWTRSGEPIIMSILGGSQAFLGPAVGAIGLTALVQKVGGGSPAYLLYVGAILLAVLILLPRGLLSLPGRVRDLRKWGRRSDIAKPDEDVAS